MYWRGRVQPGAGPGAVAEARRAGLRGAGLGLAITGALTLLFRLTDLDLECQCLAFHPDEPHWPQGERPGWQAVYRFGTLPALAVTVLAALGLGGSFVRNSWRHLRYPCLYLVLLLAIGPGFVVNVLGKNLAGRPRPDQIVEFGGLREFHGPFEFGTPGKGFSFLCGHCSMGFMFLAFFFLFRGWRRWAALAFGLAFGLVQGIGRLVQGAHFASDALLGASIMFTLAAALSPIAALQPRKLAREHNPWKVAAATAVVVTAIVVGFLFSAPVEESRQLHWLRPGAAPVTDSGATLLSWQRDASAAEPDEVVITVERDDVVIASARQPQPLVVRSWLNGYGFPGAAGRVTTAASADGRLVAYRHRLTGLIVEARVRFSVVFADDLRARLQVRSGDGEVVLAGSFGGRPIALRSDSPLHDPRGVCRRTSGGAFERGGDGPPVRLVLEARRVVVQP